MPFDRKIFFDRVRSNPFPGTLTQQQVDGMSHKLDVFERDYAWDDLRWLAYAFATSMWETSSTMWPIEEYGKGGSASYAQTDPQTGQKYYGRGDVQLTWRENYARADKELGLSGDRSCEWHAENALDADIAAAVMFQGMSVGWFRKSSDGKVQNLNRYFNDVTDDPYGAREIINGDKSKVPSWSSGAKIGDLIAGYHRAFLVALEASWIAAPAPEPEPEPGVVTVVYTVTITGPGPFTVNVEQQSDALQVQSTIAADAGRSQQSQGGQEDGRLAVGGARVRRRRQGEGD